MRAELAEVEFEAEFRTWLEVEAEALSEFRDARPLSVEERSVVLGRLHSILYATGWLRSGWPQEYGGLDGSVMFRGILHEELCRAGFRLPDSMAMLEILGPVLIEFAPAVAQRFFPALLAGEETWAQGFSEPDAGSDLASLHCRASLDGDTFVVNGQKIWASYGHLANRCLLLARTGSAESRHRGLSFLLVDLDSPGVVVNPIMAASGRNEFAEIFFDGVMVPADRLVGEINGGWEAAMYLLQWERGMYAWQRQAGLHQELGEALNAIEHPTGDGTLERIGAAFRSVHALRLASRRTLRRLSRRENPGPSVSLDKLLLSAAEQAVHDVVRELNHPALELGDAPADELARADYFYARAASMYGGSAEIQRTIVADRILGLAPEPIG